MVLGLSAREMAARQDLRVPKGKTGSVMIWAAIGRSMVRSELIVMRRDEDLPRGGHSALSYVDTL